MKVNIKRAKNVAATIKQRHIIASIIHTNLQICPQLLKSIMSGKVTSALKKHVLSRHRMYELKSLGMQEET